MAGLMCVMLSNADGSGSQDVIDHYRIQARGGAGMVIVAIHSLVDRSAKKEYTASNGF